MYSLEKIFPHSQPRTSGSNSDEHCYVMGGTLRNVAARVLTQSARDSFDDYCDNDPRTLRTT